MQSKWGMDKYFLFSVELKAQLKNVTDSWWWENLPQKIHEQLNTALKEHNSNS